jgi:NADPH-dependent 2,4-dienoyl-CoA reductase/sulfur reductase-like enzyme
MRGHRVTLLDSSDRLGGSAWFSQLTTPANDPLLDWQRQELQRLDVTVELKHHATVDSIVALRPDSIVLATGAQRGIPDVPGADLPHVHTGDTLRALITGEGGSSRGGAWLRLLGAAARLGGIARRPDLLRRVTKTFMPVGKDVVVIGGTLVGLELAEFLAQRRKNVTLVEPSAHVGLPMAIPRRWTAVRHAHDDGVRIVRNAVVEEITPTEVRYRHEGTVVSAAANLVVVASHVDSGAPLEQALVDRGLNVRTVGDADAVGYIQGAIHSAWRVGREV